MDALNPLCPPFLGDAEEDFGDPPNPGSILLQLTSSPWSPSPLDL